jgi:hypothetical protein
MNYTLEELRAIPIFFIVGKGRSGTTLLSTILDSHPNVASATESRFLLLIWQKYKNLKEWKPEMAEELFDTVMEDYRVKYLWEFHKEEFIAQFKMLPANTKVQELIKLVYIFRISNFHKEKIKFIIDKNPRYTLFIEQLAQIFKDGQFIRIIRDPRDNITSHVKFTGRKVGFLSNKWLAYNLHFDRLKERENKRFVTFKFEDLVIDKHTFFKEFEDFTGIDSLAELEEDRLNFKDKFEEKFSESLKEQHQASVKPLDPKKIGHYKQKLSATQIRTIESISFPYAEKYGYVIDQPKRSVTTKEKVAYFLGYSFHKYGNTFLYSLPYGMIVWLRSFLIRNVFVNKKSKLDKVVKENA